jgi:hypothetical protein
MTVFYVIFWSSPSEDKDNVRVFEKIVLKRVCCLAKFGGGSDMRVEELHDL